VGCGLKCRHATAPDFLSELYSGADHPFLLFNLDVACIPLFAAISTLHALDVTCHFAMLDHLLGTHYLTIYKSLPFAFHFLDLIKSHLLATCLPTCLYSLIKNSQQVFFPTHREYSTHSFHPVKFQPMRCILIHVYLLTYLPLVVRRHVIVNLQKYHLSELAVVVGGALTFLCISFNLNVLEKVKRGT